MIMNNTRYIPWLLTLAAIPAGLLLAALAPFWGGIVFAIGILGGGYGLYDVVQNRSSVLKNYPVTARLRFLFETFRPEIRQYFLESDHDEVPFSREQRSLVYRRAKGMEGLRPFGTLKNQRGVGHLWINHSMSPSHLESSDFRSRVGCKDCTKPYDSSVLNISGMSYGALSPNAILALNKGAQLGGFAHTTGEGSISKFHRENGGDLIWQIASGYFGCRNQDGTFNPDLFAERSNEEQVKMVEIKLSQGAKPGHGGILPGAKVTEEIAEARGIPVGQDCHSPARHSAFTNPLELMEFIKKCRELSGGKPIGIKLCVGHPWEFFGIAKAMIESGTTPDFITVDGSEGGTGAAPVEFADHIGAPLREGLMLVHNTLVGLGLRNEIKIIVSGKIISAFDMSRTFCLGSDICNMARGFMFAIGCIQAQACHTGHCPTGVTTQDPGRYKALVVADKYERVANFHRNTMEALKETIEATGLQHASEFTPHHLMMRISSTDVRSAASQYKWLDEGSLLTGKSNHPAFEKFWDMARTDSFVVTSA